MSNFAGQRVIVVGAGRGIGRGIAIELAHAGASVIALARTPATFPAPSLGTGSIQLELADAAGAAVPAQILDRYQPDAVILVAGVPPHMRPLQEQTWETFSLHWEADVRISFLWLREILLKPLRPGSRVIVISSGAALGGSPLSGGYAGAKSTQRFLTGYAQEEARRAGLDIAFTAVLPRFAPETGVGRLAVQAYAARAGQPVDEYLQSMIKATGPLVSAEIAGQAIAALVQQDAASLAPAYLLSGDGLKKL